MSASDPTQPLSPANLPPFFDESDIPPAIEELEHITLTNPLGEDVTINPIYATDLAAHFPGDLKWQDACVAARRAGLDAVARELWSSNPVGNDAWAVSLNYDECDQSIHENMAVEIARVANDLEIAMAPDEHDTGYSYDL